MSLDIVFTILIVVLAAAWAGRRLWRSARRRAANSTAGGCGDQSSGCGSCLVAGSTNRPDTETDITSTPCDKSQSEES